MIIFTDGSCRANGNPNAVGAWGYLVVEDIEGTIFCAVVNGEEHTTNNRMELTAIYEAVKDFGSEKHTIEIYTDSAYAIGCFETWLPGWVNNGWKRSGGKNIENLDIIQAYYHLITGLNYDVVFHKVKGHDKNIYNNTIDELVQKKSQELIDNRRKANEDL